MRKKGTRLKEYGALWCDPNDFVEQIFIGGAVLSVDTAKNEFVFGKLPVIICDVLL